MLERNRLVRCESFCNCEKERCCKSELFLRMADPSTWARECCLQWCSSASKLWSFAVWILPHHATVAHGWVAHPRPTRNAWATTFPFSSIESWGSWLTWRARMTVALRASWTYCDNFFVWTNSCLSWRGCTLLNQVTLNVSSVLLRASTWRPGWTWVPSHASTRTSLLSTHTWFSLKHKYSL